MGHQIQTAVAVVWIILGVPAGGLQYLRQIVTGQVAVAQDLRHEAWTDRLTTMQGDHRAPAIGVFQEMVTTPHTDYFEACLAQCGDELLTGQVRQLGHTSTRTLCTPTNC